MEDRKNQLDAESRPQDTADVADVADAPVPAAADEAAQGGDTANLGTSSAIGRRLKAYYDDVANEPVPDRFLALLDALDKAEAEPPRAAASPPQTGRR